MLDSLCGQWQTERECTTVPSKRTSPSFLFLSLVCSRFVPFLYLTPAAQAVPAFWSDLEISKFVFRVAALGSNPTPSAIFPRTCPALRPSGGRQPTGVRRFGEAQHAKTGNSLA
jgi:hypothetical protein